MTVQIYSYRVRLRFFVSASPPDSPDTLSASSLDPPKPQKRKSDFLASNARMAVERLRGGTR